MTADEFNQAIMERIERDPFQAFTIELYSGARLEIDRQFSIAIRGGNASCFVQGRLVPRVRSDEVRQVIDVAIGHHSSLTGGCA